ncbi:hypothetical protein M2366_003085 [Aeromonas sp. BIGb0405]|jgi:hypothetical protein|nr:hypothetical protein [Aeromonas sp. BIGb0405]MCS3461174.1 hypothetical protein [Aeromonas sp. BIGb0445]
MMKHAYIIGLMPLSMASTGILGRPEVEKV